MDCWSFVDFQSNCTISKIESCVFDSSRRAAGKPVGFSNANLFSHHGVSLSMWFDIRTVEVSSYPAWASSCNAMTNKNPTIHDLYTNCERSEAISPKNPSPLEGEGRVRGSLKSYLRSS